MFPGGLAPACPSFLQPDTGWVGVRGAHFIPGCARAHPPCWVEAGCPLLPQTCPLGSPAREDTGKGAQVPCRGSHNPGAPQPALALGLRLTRVATPAGGTSFPLFASRGLGLSPGVAGLGAALPPCPPSSSEGDCSGGAMRPPLQRGWFSRRSAPGPPTFTGGCAPPVHLCACTGTVSFP